MMTIQYEWKILEWDEKTQTNKIVWINIKSSSSFVFTNKSKIFYEQAFNFHYKEIE